MGWFCNCDKRLDSIEHKLAAALNWLQAISGKEDKIMATLDEVLADTTAERTQIDSLATLTAGIKKQLDDVLAGVALPPGVQAKVDAVFANLESNKKAVVDALNANSPPPAP